MHKSHSAQYRIKYTVCKYNIQCTVYCIESILPDIISVLFHSFLCGCFSSFICFFAFNFFLFFCLVTSHLFSSSSVSFLLIFPIFFFFSFFFTFFQFFHHFPLFFLFFQFPSSFSFIILLTAFFFFPFYCSFLYVNSESLQHTLFSFSFFPSRSFSHLFMSTGRFT